jgi:uncharacterized protein YaiE (UPF0345 family)
MTGGRGRETRMSTFTADAGVPKEFTKVRVLTKANVYFDGKVASHTVIFADGTKKTIGLIYPGSYHFNTELAERMEIVAGACKVVLDGTTEERAHGAGTMFEVPGKSGFQVSVAEGVCEYVCSFLP